jgi:translation initiation factor IF-3
LKDLKINLEIRAPLVFLIDEEGKPLGKYALSEAVRIARERGYDLAEVGPGANPPVCRLLDYGKYKYQAEKQLRKQRSAAKSGGIKEIRLSYKIEAHDRQVRIKATRRFIQAGDKVKVTLILYGRQRMFADIARQNMEEYRKLVGEVEYEGPIAQFDNRLIGILIPRKGPKSENSEQRTENREQTATHDPSDKQPITENKPLVKLEVNHLDPSTELGVNKLKVNNAQNQNQQNGSETDQKDHGKRGHDAPQDVKPTPGAPQV